MSQESRLDRAVRRVAEGRRIVAGQRDLIAHLRRRRLSITAAEEALQAFERSLAIFEEHEKAIRSETAK